MGTEVKLKREAIERRIAELEGKMPDIQASKEGAEARATIRRLKARLKTYSERHIGHYGSSECVEGNFEEDDEIPESIYDALNDFFCFGCQQALAQFEIE